MSSRTKDAINRWATEDATASVTDLTTETAATNETYNGAINECYSVVTVDVFSAALSELKYVE
jgi:hypothetical protein